MVGLTAKKRNNRRCGGVTQASSGANNNEAILGGNAMRTSVISTRAFIARALPAGLFAAIALFGLSGSSAWSQTPKDIRWGTGPVGSVGHKALDVLADLLNKEMPNYRIT